MFHIFVPVKQGEEMEVLYFLSYKDLNNGLFFYVR